MEMCSGEWPDEKPRHEDADDAGQQSEQTTRITAECGHLHVESDKDNDTVQTETDHTSTVVIQMRYANCARISSHANRVSLKGVPMNRWHTTPMYMMTAARQTRYTGVRQRGIVVVGHHTTYARSAEDIARSGAAIAEINATC